MKMTYLRMEWTDTGAVVSYEGNFAAGVCCPRCGAAVESGLEHRCGDMLPTPDTREAASEAGKARRATTKRVKK